MLELHQFRHSPYCLKVRMALAAKKLEYRTVEITPAIGQIDIFQKTGQRKLPVLFDNEITIHNSSSIIRHLEKIQIEPKLIPDNPKERSQAQIIENWADTTLAKSIKIVFLEDIYLPYGWSYLNGSIFKLFCSQSHSYFQAIR